MPSNPALKSYYKKKAYLDSVKLGAGCKVCGYSKNPRALCFHHRDAKDKTTTRISNLSWAAIETEIAFCDVMCANCHLELHYPTWEESNGA